MPIKGKAEDTDKKAQQNKSSSEPRQAAKGEATAAPNTGTPSRDDQSYAGTQGQLAKGKSPEAAAEAAKSGGNTTQPLQGTADANLTPGLRTPSFAVAREGEAIRESDRFTEGERAAGGKPGVPYTGSDLPDPNAPQEEIDEENPSNEVYPQVPTVFHRDDVGKVKEGDYFYAPFIHNPSSTDTMRNIRNIQPQLLSGRLVRGEAPPKYWEGAFEHRPPLCKKVGPAPNEFTVLG